MNIKNDYLYIIANNELGPVKIGFSNNPEHRLKTLQTGHIDELKIYYKKQFPNAMTIEKICHSMLNEKRKRGEWFSLTVEEAISYIEFAIIENEPSELVP